MIIQQKTFCIIRGASVSEDTVVEIHCDAYDSLQGSQDVVLVHDLVFGPVHDHRAILPGLWLNLAPDNFIPCSTHEAGKYVDSLKARKTGSPGYGSPVSVTHQHYQSSEVNKNPPCFHIRPHDEDAFHLVTNLMKHRLRQLKVEELSSFTRDQRDQAVQVMEDMAVCRDYHTHKRFWDEWMNWPATEGHNTPSNLDEGAPSNDHEYVIGTSSDCKNPRRVWKSFIENIGAIDAESSYVEDSPFLTCDNKRRCRLRVFQKLSNEGHLH